MLTTPSAAVDQVLAPLLARDPRGPEVVLRTFAPSEDSIMGVPTYSLAISACLLASVMTVVGFVLQKRGSQEVPDARWCIGDMVISRDFLLGVGLFACTGVPMDLFAYALAPLSLTSPLSGVTVAVNQVLAPRLLGEKAEAFPDYPAAGLIAVGTVFTTLSAPRHDPIYTPEMLWSLLQDPGFLWFLAILTLFVGSAMATMSALKETTPRGPQRHPRLFEVLLPAVAAGGAGALSNIMLKAVGVLLRAQTRWVELLPWVVLTLAPAGLQLNYMSRGLKMFPQTVFIPIYQAVLVLSIVFAGSAFYKEREQLDVYPQATQRFTAGLLLNVFGIYLFSLRSGRLPPTAEEVGETEALLGKQGISA